MKFSRLKPPCLYGHIAVSLLSLTQLCDKFFLADPAKIYKTALHSKFETEDYMHCNDIDKIYHNAALNLDDSADFGFFNVKDFFL